MSAHQSSGRAIRVAQEEREEEHGLEEVQGSRQVEDRSSLLESNSKAEISMGGADLLLRLM